VRPQCPEPSGGSRASNPAPLGISSQSVVVRKSGEKLAPPPPAPPSPPPSQNSYLKPVAKNQGLSAAAILKPVPAETVFKAGPTAIVRKATTQPNLVSKTIEVQTSSSAATKTKNPVSTVSPSVKKESNVKSRKPVIFEFTLAPGHIVLENEFSTKHRPIITTTSRKPVAETSLKVDVARPEHNNNNESFILPKNETRKLSDFPFLKRRQMRLNNIRFRREVVDEKEEQNMVPVDEFLRNQGLDVGESGQNFKSLLNQVYTEIV